MTTTTTTPGTSLDYPRMLGRAEARLIIIRSTASSAADIFTSEADLRAALREVAMLADQGSRLGDEDPITIGTECESC